MDILLSVIAFVLIFSLLVLVHEFGHFWMAKKVGIKVEEFGMGLPPRLWGKKKGDTLYSINWIPFGGFVRMFGEMGGDDKALKSKKSFIGKTARERTLVVIAGVVMNFLLAWVLLTIGFAVGMQPLLGEGDVFPAIENGQIILEPGLVVRAVDEGSAADLAGFEVGDLIYKHDGLLLGSADVGAVMEQSAGLYEVERAGKMLDLKIDTDGVGGFGFYEHTDFPSVKVFEVKKYSSAFKSGFKEGDVILSVNGRPIFDVESFDDLVRFESNFVYRIYRDGFVKEIEVESDEPNGAVISKVLPDTPAAIANLVAGDVILFVEDVEVNRVEDLINFVQEHGSENLSYLVNRKGQRLFFEMKAIDGRIGVLLSELLASNDQGLTVYNSNTLSSVVEVKNEIYPWYQAPIKAFTESYKMAVGTAKMFVGIIGSLVHGDGVPSSVAGPVGIAKMTYSFVQEGSVIPLIRFVALLSLSLAVINILPIPALDGGRLLFIIFEVILGRRLNQKWESYVHAFGYLLILALILVVTYNDIFGQI